MGQVSIQRHPAERGARGSAVAPAGQCCCCCCCCLHSIGGLVGAVSAFPAKLPAEVIPPASIDGSPRPASYSASKHYWVTVLLMCAFVVGWNLAVERHPSNEEAILIIALVFPAIQLAASVVAAIVLGFSKRPGRDQRLRHLGKITLRAFLGGMIGVVLMLPLLSKC